MESKHSQTLDELQALGGQTAVDPLLGSALIFNLRQTDQAVRGFHPKHERTVPKTHLLSEEVDEEKELVAVGSEVHSQVSAAESPAPFVDTTQNSLEKSSGTSSGSGIAFSNTIDRPSGSFSASTSRTSSVKKFPLVNREGRLSDPFTSIGSILPPPEPGKNLPDPDESDISKTVRMQYEKLPYPFRDPEEDKKRLTMPLIDNLMIVNQRCFQGKMNFHGEFRMLVAGGGTGDASTYLAVQTAWLPNAKVVYVDLSTESMKIAKERLHNQTVRLGHPNIEEIVEFHHGSLLDVEKMGIGKFDYINCSGVLHHLKKPDEGLAALRSVLKDDGAMSIMVYGQVGRTTIYQMQELMRIVNRNVDDMDEKIKNTNLFLRYLPSSNLHRLGGRWSERIQSGGNLRLVSPFAGSGVHR